MTSIKISNYSKVSSKKDNTTWYDWCVFVDEPLERLNQISKVKYILHPTFPNPERLISDKDSKFALYSNGWGVFLIRIEIYLMNGEIIKTKHQLRLQDNDWPVKEVDLETLDSEEKKVYETIMDSSFKWRKYQTIANKTEMPNQDLVTSLENLEKLNFIRKSPFKSVDNDELYGVTPTVGIKPE